MLNKEDIIVLSKVLEEEFLPNLMILFNPMKEVIYMISHLQEIFTFNNQGIFMLNNQGQIFMTSHLELISMDTLSED